MDNGLTASDALLLGGGANGGLGGLGGFGGIIGLLAVLGMIGNGGLFGWGGNNAANDAVLASALNNGYKPQYATQQDVQYTAQFGQLLDGNRDIINNVNDGHRDLSNLITNSAAQAVAASNQARYDNINVMKDVQTALSGQISDVKAIEQSILGNQNECCSNTKMMVAEGFAATNANIAQAKYDTSMQMAQMEARLTAKMDQNEITGLRDKIQTLELAQATNGVLRFPNQWSYGAGPFPPIFGGCPCNNV
jgi:hypothetical protein